MVELDNSGGDSSDNPVVLAPFVAWLGFELHLHLHLPHSPLPCYLPSQKKKKKIVSVDDISHFQMPYLVIWKNILCISNYFFNLYQDDWAIILFGF